MDENDLSASSGIILSLSETSSNIKTDCTTNPIILLKIDASGKSPAMQFYAGV